MKSIKGLAFIFCTAASINAHASLIDPLEYSRVNKTWLMLSETVGLSMNDFRNGAGGWSTKYRLASSQEIAALVSSYGIGLGDSGYKEDAAGAADFIQTIAGYTNGGAGTYFDSNGDQRAFGRGIGWYVAAELSSGDGSYPRGPDCPEYFSCERTVAINAAQSPSARGTYTGLFLIRDDSPRGVPEPGSLALLGLAGSLLAYQRRKKRA